MCRTSSLYKSRVNKTRRNMLFSKEGKKTKEIILSLLTQIPEESPFDYRPGSMKGNEEAAASDLVDRLTDFYDIPTTFVEEPERRDHRCAFQQIIKVRHSAD
jgi:hypothetical protein